MPDSLDPIQVRLARLDFLSAVKRDIASLPRIDADHVAEQGHRVLIVDVRDETDLLGPLGWVPTSRHVPLPRIMDLLRLGRGARIALLSTKGHRAGVAARLLELAGMRCVAAIAGGLEGWRELGLPLAYGPEGLDTTLPDDVDAVLLQPERPTGPLTLDEVRRHVEDATHIRWVKLAAFLLHGRTACVDGRDSQGVVGTPGGEAGELLLALATAEALGQQVDDTCLSALLAAWIDAFGRFYLHSDILAMHQLGEALRADPRVPAKALPPDDAPPDDWGAFVASPPASIRPVLLEHLTAPEHLGCGHLRLALLHGATYGVRPELVRSFLRAFFRALWNGLPEIDYVVLGGGHQEGGVLLVKVDDTLLPYTRVPLVPPGIGGVQLFVHHPQVTAFQRDEVAHWLSTAQPFPALRGRDAEIRATLLAIGERQMTATLGALAQGLPIYEATFALDRSVTVRALGHVGG